MVIGHVDGIKWISSLLRESSPSLLQPFISGNVEFFFSDGAATVTLQEDLGGGNSCQLAGDANGDGTVNVIDIVLTTNLILCSDCPDNYNACSDVNGDMLINVLDIVAIVNQILGL